MNFMFEDIPVTEQGYYSTLWYASNGEIDWMCLLYKEKNDSSFEARYRFRYYREKTAFGDKDVKHWYKIEMDKNQNEDDAVAKITLVGTIISDRMASTLEFIKIGGNSKKMLETLQTGNLNFLHMKKL